MKFKQSVCRPFQLLFTTFNGSRLFPVDEKPTAKITNRITELLKTRVLCNRNIHNALHTLFRLQSSIQIKFRNSASVWHSVRVSVAWA